MAFLLSGANLCAHDFVCGVILHDGAAQIHLSATDRPRPVACPAFPAADPGPIPATLSTSCWTQASGLMLLKNIFCQGFCGIITMLFLSQVATPAAMQGRKATDLSEMAGLQD
jgi:hypothetical protein